MLGTKGYKAQIIPLPRKPNCSKDLWFNLSPNLLKIAEPRSEANKVQKVAVLTI